MAAVQYTDSQVERSTPDRLVVAFYAVQIFALIALQKFAIAGVQLCLPILMVSLIALIPAGKIAFDPLRFTLLSIFMIAAAASQIAGGIPFSAPSFMIIIALYAPMALVIPVTRETFLKCVNVFQTAMLLVLGVVLIQHAIQVAASYRAWPDLDKLVPPQFLLSGYNYIQPLKYGAQFYKPNAVVFLEVSFISQFAALAFILEAVFFRRLMHLAAYILLVILTFAGTGILVLSIAAPFLLAKAGPKALLVALLGAIIVGTGAVASGYVAQIGSRVNEFQQPGTSGYSRFAAPMLMLIDRAEDPANIFKGIGAGNTPDVSDTATSDVALPPMKLVNEYGFVSMFAFFTFLLVAMFRGSPSRRMCIGFLAFFLFGGGSLAVPAYALMCMLFCTLLRIVRTPDDETEEEPPGYSYAAAA
jgi:hypothetical protein